MVSGVPLPTSLPFSVPIINTNGSCSMTGTFVAEIVNGGLEVELDLSVNGTTCWGSGSVDLELDMVIPELGGTATMVRLNLVPLVTNFPVIGSVSGSSSMSGDGAVTSSVDGNFKVQFGDIDWGWYAGSPSYPSLPSAQRMIPLIPGDTLRFPLQATLSMSDATSFSGTLRMRYEFLVTVPEPSATLSLPIGVLGVAGLAAMKGSV